MHEEMFNIHGFCLRNEKAFTLLREMFLWPECVQTGERVPDFELTGRYK